MLGFAEGALSVQELREAKQLVQAEESKVRRDKDRLHDEYSRLAMVYQQREEIEAALGKLGETIDYPDLDRRRLLELFVAEIKVTADRPKRRSSKLRRLTLDATFNLPGKDAILELTGERKCSEDTELPTPLDCMSSAARWPPR